MQTYAALVLLDATPLSVGASITAECLEVELAIHADTTVTGVIDDLHGALSAMNYSSTVPLDHRAGLALVMDNYMDGSRIDHARADDEDDDDDLANMPWSPVSPHGWITAVSRGESTSVVLCGQTRLLENPVVRAALDGSLPASLIFRVVPAPAVATVTAAAAVNAPDLLPPMSLAAGADHNVRNPSTATRPGSAAATTSPDAEREDLPANAGPALSSLNDASTPALVRALVITRSASAFDHLQWADPVLADGDGGLANVHRQVTTLPPASPEEVRRARAALEAAMQYAYGTLDGIFPDAADLPSNTKVPVWQHRLLTAMAEEAALYEAEAQRLQQCAVDVQRWQQGAVAQARLQVQELEARLTERRGHASVVAPLRTQLGALQAQLERHRREEAQLLHALSAPTPVTASHGLSAQPTHTSEEEEEEDEVAFSPPPPLGPSPHRPPTVEAALDRALRTSAVSPSRRVLPQNEPHTASGAGHVYLSSDSSDSVTSTESSPTLSELPAPPSPPPPPPLSVPMASAAAAAPSSEGQPPANQLASPLTAEAAVQYSPSETSSSSLTADHATDTSSPSSLSPSTPPSPSSSSAHPPLVRGPVVAKTARTASPTAGTTHTWQRLHSSLNDSVPLSEAESASDASGDIEAELDTLHQVTSRLSAHLRSPQPDPQERRHLLGEVRTLRQRLNARSVHAAQREPLRQRSDAARAVHDEM